MRNLDNKLALVTGASGGLGAISQPCGRRFTAPYVTTQILGSVRNSALEPWNIDWEVKEGRVLDARTRTLFPFIERIYADGG